MESHIDPKLLRVINTTKKVLGKHISKPVLADKYLGRPPFRFLLEIVTGVIQQTNFMKEVFSPKELKYDEIATGEHKRVFLKKVIDAIENETGEQCDARVSKILAGKEPEKTNEMLQLLAKAISSFSSKSKQIVEPPVEKIEETTKLEVKTSSPAKSPADKKSYAQSTSSSNAKVKSGEKSQTLANKSSKPSLVKNTTSSPSARVASKTKLESPSASKSTLLPPKKLSSTSISRSQSRQSIAAKSSTSLSPNKNLSESVKSEENIKISESQDKLVQKSEEHIVVKPTTAAMPPETTEEVPLQRPVTRTKYRQKVEGDCTDTPVILTFDSGSEPILVNENAVEEENEKKVGSSCGLQSGRSSSSEEVVTDHMNQKISEWVDRPVEPMQVAESQLVGSPRQLLPNSGWIRDDYNSDHQLLVKSQMNRVFNSLESCDAQQDASSTLRQSENAPFHCIKPGTARAEEASKKPAPRPVTVLRDNESEDEDDESFLVQEKIESERDLALERLQQSALLMKPGTRGSSSPTNMDMLYFPPEHRGGLVNQILETRMALEKLSGGHGKALMENEMAERDKAAVREVYLRQVEDLKEAIQNMSKCANPLANVIQRSQDDACLMEIEFRKLRQENERLQKEIDSAKSDTSRILYPLTEELAQLDSRIGKVEGAILLAKQRLSLIDTEYAAEFIMQIENTPTEDEARAVAMASDPVWQFRGNFLAEDDDQGEGFKGKSLMSVFKRAVTMHDESSAADISVEKSNFLRLPSNFCNSTRKGLVAAPPGERRLLNKTVYIDDLQMSRSKSNRGSTIGEPSKPPVNIESKPSWWD